MKKVHLGLDLGIASIGWSLVDEEQKILATGSHLFSKLSDPQNNKKYGEGIRGSYRRIRRMNNRKKQRKIDFLNMIDLYNDNHQNKINSIGKESKFYKAHYQNIFGFTKEYSSSDFLFKDAKKYNVYQIWKKGLEKEINPKELFVFLYFKLGMRGVFFKKYDFDKNTYTYEDSLLKNIFENKYFLENQKYRNKSNGDYTFSIEWNWFDIEKVLKNCSYISEEFINDYKSIFMRHRDYAYGPGSFKQLSPWGVQEFDENNKPLYTLWESKIGLCPISLSLNQGDKNKTEKRLSQYLFISELTNIISQLIYIRIGLSVSNTEYLSKDHIIKVINKSIKEDKKINLKMICDIVGSGIDKDNIFGFPTDKEDQTKPNFESLSKIRNYFHKEKIIEMNLDNFDIEKIWETIVEIDKKRFEIIKKYYENQKNNQESKSYNELVKNNKDFKQSKNELINSLNKIDFVEYKINYDNLANFNSINESNLFGTRNFGWSAYYNYLQHFFNEDQFFKSMSVFYKNEIYRGKKYLYSFKKSKYLPEDMFKNLEFISPNAKNTIKETIRIINRILKMHIYKNDLNLKSIIIETTYDSESIKDSLLSEEQGKRISQLQKFNEDKRIEAISFLKKENLDFSSESMIEKTRLYLEQNCNDVYQNKSITPREIKDCQVDHIIPYEISFNNNWENKVLTLRNSEKGKKIPQTFLSKDEYNNLSIKWREIYGIKSSKNDEKENKKISFEQKIKNLKYKNLTISEIELERKNFINSNLSETTYAISKFKEGLDFWIEEIKENNDILELNRLKDCDIRTISGFQSQLLRKEIFNLPKKDRNISNHHSHDASMIALYSSIGVVDDFYDSIKKSGYEYVKDRIKRIKYNNFDQNKFLSIKYLKHNLKENLPLLKNEILNSNCLFSFKKITILSKEFKNKTIEEKWEEIRKINPKQIFANELPNSHIEIDNKKYQINKLNLLDEKSANKIHLIFKTIHEKVNNLEIKNEKNIKKIIKEFCNQENKDCEFKKIITSENIIYDLYLCISSSFEKGTFDNDIKEYKILFKKYNSNLIKEVLKIDNDKKYNNLISQYVVILKNNNSLLKIKNIKLIDLKLYHPTFEKETSLITNSSENKQIFNLLKRKEMLKNTSLFGDQLKFLAIIKFIENNKEKIDCFKINQLNKIVRFDKKNKIVNIFFIDINKWFLIDNEIYRISSYDIDNNRIEIKCVSNINVKFRKTLSALRKSTNELEQKIYRKILDNNII
ncbi:type II CRISPR RNA-guided endonuclease Cas9 [Mesomycoplasma moatsii]|uniref:type II CRISPR RNA-guided endonuclease Cas9 n=1 Tax=Mesomycoplasma moatsii TaxID=171287 RepID=UPI0003B372C0